MKFIIFLGLMATSQVFAFTKCEVKATINETGEVVAHHIEIARPNLLSGTGNNLFNFKWDDEERISFEYYTRSFGDQIEFVFNHEHAKTNTKSEITNLCKFTVNSTQLEKQICQDQNVTAEITCAYDQLSDSYPTPATDFEIAYYQLRSKIEKNKKCGITLNLESELNEISTAEFKKLVHDRLAEANYFLVDKSEIHSRNVSYAIKKEKYKCYLTQTTSFQIELIQ